MKETTKTAESMTARKQYTFLTILRIEIEIKGTKLFSYCS